jgi:hemoglobin
VRREFNTGKHRSVSSMGIGLIVITLGAAVLVPAGFSFGQGMPAPPKEKTLYQRMGGYDVIAAVVDDFIKQLGQDEAFKRFGGGRSMDSLHRTRQLVVDQTCYLAGGPCVYIGRDTKTAHAGLAITQEEWDLSIKHFKTALDDQKVAEPEQKDFLAMIEKLRPDVVEKPKGDYPQADKSKTQN